MENQHNKSENAALNALRSDIDQIDDQIISLLGKRMEIIKKVGDLKKSNNEKFFIRSSREADMIKALIKKSDSAFSKATIANIWRKIITTANVEEQGLKVAIHNPKNISDYNYLVREYYNDAVPISTHDSVTGVIVELEKNEAQIGIFDISEQFSTIDQEEHDRKSDMNENWWISLANNRSGLKIFAKIPFVEYVDKQEADPISLVAVAIKESEKSAEDNTLLCVELSSEVSRSQFLSAFKEQGLNAKILKVVKIHQVEKIVFYLVELSGFYVESDEVIKNFTKSKIKSYVKVLGSYALPVKV